MLSTALARAAGARGAGRHAASAVVAVGSGSRARANTVPHPAASTSSSSCAPLRSPDPGTGASPAAMTPFTRALAEGVLRGDRVSLSRAITLCESANPNHEKQAERLLEYVLMNRDPASERRTFRVGVTG